MKQFFISAFAAFFLLSCGNQQAPTDAKSIELAASTTDSNAVGTINERELRIAKLVGKWKVKLDVKENNCQEADAKVAQEEVWTISHKDLEVLVHIDDEGELVKEFKGVIEDNKLVIEGDKQDVIGVYEMNFLGDSAMDGKKSIVYPGPCAIDYKVNATKLD